MRFSLFNNLLSCQILLPNRPLISFRVRTSVQLLALIAGFSLAATQTRAAEENETVVTSPDGTYELHQVVPDVDLTNARSAELEAQLKESETQ